MLILILVTYLYILWEFLQIISLENDIFFPIHVPSLPFNPAAWPEHNVSETDGCRPPARLSSDLQREAAITSLCCIVFVTGYKLTFTQLRKFPFYSKLAENFSYEF